MLSTLCAAAGGSSCGQRDEGLALSAIEIGRASPCRTDRVLRRVRSRNSTVYRGSARTASGMRVPYSVARRPAPVRSCARRLFIRSVKMIARWEKPELSAYSLLTHFKNCTCTDRARCRCTCGRIRHPCCPGFGSFLGGRKALIVSTRALIPAASSASSPSSFRAFTSRLRVFGVFVAYARAMLGVNSDRLEDGTEP